MITLCVQNAEMLLQTVKIRDAISVGVFLKWLKALKFNMKIYRSPESILMLLIDEIISDKIANYTYTNNENGTCVLTLVYMSDGEDLMVFYNRLVEEVTNEQK